VASTLPFFLNKSFCLVCLVFFICYYVQFDSPNCVAVRPQCASTGFVWGSWLVALERPLPGWSALTTYSSQTFACSYTALQLVCLVLWCLAPAIRTKASIPSTALSLASALATVPLSYYEHTRTFRPSTIIGVFLGFTLILDAAIVRTLWLRQDGLSISVVSSVGMTTKGVMLLLESQPKMPANSNGQKISKEAASGIYNRILFWWLRPLFSRGYRNNLDLDDLDTLEDEFASADLRIRMKHAWDNSQSAAPQKSRWTLALAVCSAMKYPLLAPMPARLAFIGFSYSQPFLITAAINYVQTPATGRNRNHGYGLIGAAGLVYLGIAVCSATLGTHELRGGVDLLIRS